MMDGREKRIDIKELEHQLSTTPLIVGHPLTDDMGVGSKEQDRHMASRRIGTYHLKQLNAIDVRHLNIEHHQAWLALQNTREGMLATWTGLRRNTFVLQHITNQINNRRFIVDNDDRRLGWHKSVTPVFHLAA